MADGITFPILIGAAVIDSINPCAFGVLIFLLAYLSKTARTKAHMLLHGLVYLAAVFLTYFVAGLVLLPLIQTVTRAFTVYAYYLIAGLIFLAGLVEIKDFFWYGKGFSLGIFPSAAARIKMYVKHVTDKISTAFFLGVFVALVELPCTGAVYLAVLTMMSTAGATFSNITFLLLYNLIFVLPLGVIIALFVAGVKQHEFERWRHKHKGLMRLAAGLLLVGMATWMFAYAAGL
jgi:cytochrome c biogenesis protein CcdA